MDDIVTFLREDACQYGEWENACTAEGPCPSCMAADEIERLRKALALAVGELSTYAPYEDRSPENLFEFFKEAASHD